MCGIFAVTECAAAADVVRAGLLALQHRGQESSGIVSSDGEKIHAKAGMGLVSDVFPGPAAALLPGRAAAGHVRYSTAGESLLKNAQPLMFGGRHGALAIAHNGNFTNAAVLRRDLEARGAIFQSSTDSEVAVHLMARRGPPLERAFIGSLRRIEGAYSLIVFTPGRVLAARDPLGFRPLVLGRLGRGFVLASETAALDAVKASFVREVEPGEVLILEKGRVRSLRPFTAKKALARCVFEHVYFARPDSQVFGRNVQAARREMGRQLAREMEGVRTDIVVPVPDSGVSAALGFSDVSGVPFEMALVRNHYVTRTFIKPTQAQRESSAAMKLFPVAEALRGRRVVLVDDSIVRGTTSRLIVRRVREAGAREIHMAIASPPIVSPCHYGINTPRAKELIAAGRGVEAVRKFLEADSLRYLSLEGLLKAAGGPAGEGGFCSGCFTGRYPAPVPAGEKSEPRGPARK
ncbi:MAG: amidophosphoribosyltransferase [Elusimicrobia bacterium]|nr:amidophosphoribosyltransferase [Elusimicrobiota bacterium]